MMAAGRPRKIKENEKVIIQRMAAQGMSIRAVCEVIEIDESTAHRSSEFRKYYKEAFYEFGGKVRALLYDKALAGDTTACIYLDKVTNKTTEKYHDDNIKHKKAMLEFEKQRNKADTNAEDKTAEFITALMKGLKK